MSSTFRGFQIQTPGIVDREFAVARLIRTYSWFDSTPSRLASPRCRTSLKPGREMLRAQSRISRSR